MNPRKKLQDIRDTAYERPNQPFVCGLAAEGISCPLGPTLGGRCSHGAACFPVKEGDRWTCGRPTSLGGTCHDGPSPDGQCCHALSCTPVASPRVKRGRWIAGLTLFTLGLLLTAFGSSFRNEILAPGPLSQSHAQIIRREDAAQRCAACHSAGNGGIVEWCLRGAGWAADLGPTQSQLCLKCHEKTLPAAVALLPHTMPAELLRQKTEALRTADTDDRRAGFSLHLSTKRDALECATCHREHHGPKHDLTAVTNAQCRVCHQQEFVDLAHGHPEFSRRFSERPPQLAFNHHVHRDKHFVAGKREFACNTCHLDDPQRNAKTVAPFAQACASCHDGKIRTSTLEGIVFLQLPTIDIEALGGAGEALAHWPESARGDFDGKLPQPLRMLLSVDPAVKEALAVLGDDADFAELNANRPEHLQAVAVIATGIARLWSDLGERGHEAIEARLRLLLPEDRAAGASALTTGLSPDTLAATASWLRSEPRPLHQAAIGPQPLVQRVVYDEDELLDEVDNPLRKPPPAPPPAPLPMPPPEVPLPPEEVPPEPERSPPDPPQLPAPRPLAPFLSRWQTEPLHRGAWYADERTLSLRYIPTGHADPILTGWMNAAAGVKSPGAKSLDAHGLGNAKSAGLCRQCHLVDRSADDTFAVHWRFEPADRRGFTKFAHRPHLIQPQLADCTHCHSLRAGGAAAGFVEQPAGHGDFEPYTKQSCVMCHNAGAAGDGCLQCHKYHVHTGGR